MRQELISRGLDVFLAEESTPPGADWSRLISAALRHAELLLLLDSPDSRASQFVQQEAGMALASGIPVIPVSLDGKIDQLPGWLSGIEAIRVPQLASSGRGVAAIADEVGKRLGVSRTATPSEIRGPGTLGASVLRTLLLDQFSAPEERIGAWSRQYDRYLRIYYGDAAIRPSVSQGASLTFTGMVSERLSAYAKDAPAAESEAAIAAQRRAAAFVLASHDPTEGGFGRLSSDFRVRSGRTIHLDLRHSCWAIRALLCIDKEAFSEQIDAGLSWIAARARRRADEDAWCWTAAVMYSLIQDTRLRDRQWGGSVAALRDGVQSDLEQNFDARWRSWVRGEEPNKRPRLAIDNALYVLYCLRDIDSLPERLRFQREAAIQGLVARTRANGKAECGLPLFASDQPTPGATAQLLEVTSPSELGHLCGPLGDFVASQFSRRMFMDETFPWHLSAVLSLPDLWRREIVSDAAVNSP